MTETPGTMLRSWFQEVWNNRRTDLIGKYFAENGRVHGLDETGASATGPAEFLVFFEKMHAAFSEIQFKVSEVFESNSMAACRWTATMVHSGDNLGLPATNQPVTVTGMTIVRAEGSQIVESWNEWDRLAMLTAIGALGPAQPG